LPSADLVHISHRSFRVKNRRCIFEPIRPFERIVIITLNSDFAIASGWITGLTNARARGLLTWVHISEGVTIRTPTNHLMLDRPETKSIDRPRRYLRVRLH